MASCDTSDQFYIVPQCKEVTLQLDSPYELFYFCDYICMCISKHSNHLAMYTTITRKNNGHDVSCTTFITTTCASFVILSRIKMAAECMPSFSWPICLGECHHWIRPCGRGDLPPPCLPACSETDKRQNRDSGTWWGLWGQRVGL